MDDALIARPEDFYAWGGPETGKYVPWSDVSNRRKFQDDLRRMIEYRLSGGELVSLRPSGAKTSTMRLPELTLTDLDGQSFALASLRGKPVIVEFWASWCPPCLDTMSWLRELDPEVVEIVAIAVESDREDVDRVVARFRPSGRIVEGTPAMLDQFGGVQAVPTLFVADRDGKIVRVFYGAPPDLHARIEETLADLAAGS